jgi:hypothetical protein
MMKMLLSSLILCGHMFPDAYEHYITSVLDDGKFMIEDGSVWLMDSFNEEKLYKLQQNKLSFRAEETWIGSEVICQFVDKKTNDAIKVLLVSAPKSYEEKSHWIAYLEPKKSILFLDNGSIFSLYDNDREYFNNWLADDFVITGDYKSWLSQDKHILFNYRTKEFIFGDLH